MHIGQFEKKDQIQGLSLVEILVAMTLFSIAVVALIFSLNSSYQAADLMQDRGLANRAAANALEHLKTWDFGTVYNDFSRFNGPDKAFAVMADGSIQFPAAGSEINGNNTPPTNLPVGAVGYGWFKFVNCEDQYLTSEWGTETVWPTTQPAGLSDAQDLNGDGTATAGDCFTLGRTSGSPIPTSPTDPAWNYYIILPVTVTIRIINLQNRNLEMEVVRRDWLFNSNFK